MTQNKYTSTILDTIYNINYTYNPLQRSHWQYLQYLYIPQ